MICHPQSRDVKIQRRFVCETAAEVQHWCDLLPSQRRDVVPPNMRKYPSGPYGCSHFRRTLQRNRKKRRVDQDVGRHSARPRRHRRHRWRSRTDQWHVYPRRTCHRQGQTDGEWKQPRQPAAHACGFRSACLLTTACWCSRRPPAWLDEPSRSCQSSTPSSWSDWLSSILLHDPLCKTTQTERKSLSLHKDESRLKIAERKWR